MYFGLGFSFPATSFLSFASRPTVLESPETKVVVVTSGGSVLVQRVKPAEAVLHPANGGFRFDQRPLRCRVITLTSTVSWSNGSGAFVFVRDGVTSSMTVSALRLTTMRPILIMILLFRNEDA